MDWGKAKNVILIFLVITNIFLIGVYGARYREDKESSSELYSYTIEQLEANDIRMECDIPEKPDRIPTLTIQYEENPSEEKVIAAVMKIRDSEEAAESRAEYEEMAGIFLDECGVSLKDAALAGYEERDDGSVIVTYENHYGRIPLQECAMNVVFRDGYVSRLQRQWISAVEEGTAKLEITEPVTALLSFIDIVKSERNESVPEKIVEVEDIRLVYYADKSSVTESILYDTAFPAWQIRYDGGRIRYISAFEQ